MVKPGKLEWLAHDITHRGVTAWLLSALLFAFFLVLFYTEVFARAANAMGLGSKWTLYGLLYSIAVVGRRVCTVSPRSSAACSRTLAQSTPPGPARGETARWGGAEKTSGGCAGASGMPDRAGTSWKSTPKAVVIRLPRVQMTRRAVPSNVALNQSDRLMIAARRIGTQRCSGRVGS